MSRMPSNSLSMTSMTAQIVSENSDSFVTCLTALDPVSSILRVSYALRCCLTVSWHSHRIIATHSRSSQLCLLTVSLVRLSTTDGRRAFKTCMRACETTTTHPFLSGNFAPVHTELSIDAMQIHRHNSRRASRRSVRTQRRQFCSRSPHRSRSRLTLLRREYFSRPSLYV